MEHLKSIIPELKTCRITYDLNPNKLPPQTGDYLVSIGQKNGVYRCNSVYQVESVRKVASKKPRPLTRWELTCYRTPDMKEYTVVNVHGWGVWVAGRQSWPIHWYKRTKKK